MSTDDKLTVMIASLNKLHNKWDALEADLHEGDECLITRLTKVEEKASCNSDEVGQLQSEVRILKDLVHRQDKPISSLKDKVTDLTERQMAGNFGLYRHL